MNVMQLLILLISFLVLDARYPLYHSDNQQVSYPIFDCLYAHHIHFNLPEEPFVSIFQLTPYCRRPEANNNQEDLADKPHTNTESMISFEELKRQGVTSEQLLMWSLSLDMAERYERNATLSHEVFHNCSSPWFGSTCQYKFNYSGSDSFSHFVSATFRYQFSSANIPPIITCYPFLPNCYHGPSPMCLDWREVCDGKFDCINGEDEQMCERLEVNECADNEYRCHYGGQCIPLSFARDGPTSTDCLDGTDESERDRAFCYMIPTFECEERICRYPHSLPCGNGQCISNSMWPISCSTHRDTVMSHIMLTSIDHISDIACQKALRCLLRLSNDTTSFGDISHCQSLSMHCSSKWLVLPLQPILHGFFQFIYMTNRSVADFEKNELPDFICFDRQKCSSLLPLIVHIGMNIELTCYHTSDLLSQSQVPAVSLNRLMFYLRHIAQRCLSTSDELSCSHSSLFHCERSLKCISHHRLVDGFNDCYWGEDESFPACQLNDSNRYVCESTSDKCLSPVAVRNLLFDCPMKDDEQTIHERNHMSRPPFSYFCDGWMDLKIHDGNETDETHCELWPCNNAYTQCNQDWNCANGADELNCPDTSCRLNEHKCRKVGGGSMKDDLCLPFTLLFDKYFDRCHAPFSDRRIVYTNKTNINTSEYFPWINTKCITLDTLCKHNSISQIENDQVCPPETVLRTDNWYTIDSMNYIEASCRVSTHIKPIIFGPHLVTLRLGYYPATSIISPEQVSLAVEGLARKLPLKVNIPPSWYCNRGILVVFKTDENKTCLCPPSYFGDRCQWQSQRVSLTLQLVPHNIASKSIVFQVIAMLIDEYGQIAPNHEQITYVPTRDCGTKFNIYLLYPDRPKRPSANYSVHVDVFDKKTLAYHISWYLPIPFQFLPVNRIAAKLFIPQVRKVKFCPLSCGDHGHCIEYANQKSLYFCQCDQGYSGSVCNIIHTCNCSADSLCLAPSICVCPSKKFGSLCYLEHSMCRSSTNPCKNYELCVPSDDRIC